MERRRKKEKEEEERKKKENVREARPRGGRGEALARAQCL
jgi:hypothetical protein